jgi:hypothetical protein
MITQQLNQVSFAQFAAEILSDTGGRLLKQQSDIADIYLSRSGWLAEKLLSGIYQVNKTGDGANMVINYPDYIRFLDLKKSRRGRLKKVYHPIYNRPLYGFVYGYAFARLRVVLNSTIRDAMAVEDKLSVEVSV